MIKLRSMSLLAGVLCAAGGALAADGAKKQVIPDFATTDKTSWLLDHTFGVDDLLPPPAGGPGPITSDKAHPYVPNNYGPRSTYRVADLSNPILQPWTIPSMKKANDEVLAGKVPFRARERCWPVGVPGFDAYSLVEPFYFYQTPEKVVVIAQNGPEVRHIYLNVTHSQDVKPSWYGESVGHYENGDTLVIDTIGISAKSFVDNYARPIPINSMWWSAGSSRPTARRWMFRSLSRTRAHSRHPGRRCSAGDALKTRQFRLWRATRTTAISSARGWCRCRCPKRRSPIFDLSGVDVPVPKNLTPPSPLLVRLWNTGRAPAGGLFSRHARSHPR
jgi:hypothetical protein